MDEKMKEVRGRVSSMKFDVIKAMLEAQDVEDALQKMTNFCYKELIRERSKGI